MTSRSFRRLFPQLNVQSVPEDEFYRQACLSQLLTGPDEQELASFRPDIKDPLELVEATPELAGMLGSSLEFVDTRYLESSPPPTPPPPTSLNFPPEPQRGPADSSSKADAESQNRNVNSGLRNGEIPAPAAKVEAKTAASVWEVQQLAGKLPGGPASGKPNVIINVNMWEQSKNIRIASKVDVWQLQRHSRLTPEHLPSVLLDPRSRTAAPEPQRKGHSDSGTLEQGSSGGGTANSATPESKVDAWQQQLGDYPARNTPAAPDLKATQRLRCRTAGGSDPSDPPEPRQTPTNGDSADSDGPKRQSEAKAPDSSKALADGRVWELQRLRSKTAGIAEPAKPSATVDVAKWEEPGAKRAGGATKREASVCDLGQGAKTLKLDPAWQRSLGNVRVHIRDLGMKVLEAAALPRDLKAEQGKAGGKAVRAKARS